MQRRLPDIYVVDNHVNADATSGVADKPEIEVEESVGVWVGQDGGVTVETERETAAGATADCVLSLSSGQDSSNTSAGAKGDMAATSRGVAAKRRATPQKKTSRTLASRLANDRRLRLSRLTRRSGGTAADSSANDAGSKICKARDRNANRRERKATKTLAIVLGIIHFIHACTTALLYNHGLSGYLQLSTPTPPLSPQTLHPQKFRVGMAQHADHGYSRQRSVAYHTSYTIMYSKCLNKR